MDKSIEQRQCETCGEKVAYFNTIYISSTNKLTCSCLRCYNERIAKECDSNFEHVEFEPVILEDISRVNHEFYFTVRNLGDRVVIESFEIKDGNREGYEFSIIGDIDNDIIIIFGKLIERMRRALNRKHIEWCKSTNRFQIAVDDIVRARIDCDLESDEYNGRHLPLIVIDGKEIKWNDFGHMLMTYEGFNFKLNIFDKSDEIP